MGKNKSNVDLNQIFKAKNAGGVSNANNGKVTSKSRNNQVINKSSVGVRGQSKG